MATIPLRAALAGLLLCLGASPVLADTSEPAEYQLSLEEMRTFTEVFARIKQSYVKPVSDEVLIESAIKGMLSNLDPHTEYLDTEEYAHLEENTTGQFTGIGIEVIEKGGQIVVVSPIDDTPAARAGFQSGDRIIAINGTETADIPFDRAVELIRGKPGTELTLTVRRPDVKKPIDITVSRATIEIESVSSRMLEDHYAYIRISAFQKDTGDNLRKIVKKLAAEHDLHGIVLDLRNNPGGVLHAAVEVSDLFLEGGLIVYTKGRTPAAEMHFYADTRELVAGVPMVVLINSGTASASEIVAGALQDHNRAVLMGETSFGKGSVQTVLPLGNGKAVKLTTALYYTPDGGSIQATGITPDIIVRAHGYKPTVPVEKAQREADLSGHLEVAHTDNGSEHSHVRLAREDFQLFQALSLLKGVHLLSRAESEASAPVE